MNSKNKIHFIGIGGIGVSALAKIYLAKGFQVSGSDLSQNQQTDELIKMGAKVKFNHESKNINNPNQVIYSLAIPEENPELIESKNLNIPTLSYPEALGELTKNYKLIAIAGSHGKTTTTGMLAKILVEADLDPTIIIGSTLNILDNQNFRVGKSDIFLLEACEYYAGFLNLHPDITLITNLEHDHFDSYPSEESYLKAFQQLINQSQYTVLNTDFPLSQKIKQNQNTQTFSQSDKKIPLGIPGIHNQTNAQGAIKVANLLNIENPGQYLKNYTGTGRRFQVVSQSENQIIYDDYGHHPTEIKATLQALKEKHPNQSICVIYQPHQHNRSLALLNQFKEVFKDYDKIIIPDIYAARDSKQEKEDMTAERFAKEINGIYVPKIYSNKTKFHKQIENYQVVIIMGAGDVFQKISHLL